MKYLILKTKSLLMVSVLLISTFTVAQDIQVTSISSECKAEKGSDTYMDVTVDNASKKAFLNYELTHNAKRKAKKKRRERGDYVKLICVDSNLTVAWEKDAIMLKKSMHTQFKTNGDLLVGMAYKRRLFFRKDLFELQAFETTTGELRYRHVSKVKLSKYKFLRDIELIGDNVILTGSSYPKLWKIAAQFYRMTLFLPVAIFHIQKTPFYNQYPARYAMNIRSGKVYNLLGKRPYKSAYGTKVVSSNFVKDSTALNVIYNTRYRKGKSKNFLVETDLLGRAIKSTDINLLDPGEVNSAKVFDKTNNNTKVIAGTYLKKEKVKRFYNVVDESRALPDNATGVFVQHWDDNDNKIMSIQLSFKQFPELYKKAVEFGTSIISQPWYAFWDKSDWEPKKHPLYQERLNKKVARYKRKDWFPLSILLNNVQITERGYLIVMEMNQKVYSYQESSAGEDGGMTKVFMGYQPALCFAVELDKHGNVLWSKVTPLFASEYEENDDSELSFYTGLNYFPIKTVSIKESEEGGFDAVFSDEIKVHVEKWDEQGKLLYQHPLISKYNKGAIGDSESSTGMIPWYDGNYIIVSQGEGNKKKKKEKPVNFRFTKISIENE